ncbi:SOS response-associated peptidase [Pseudoalteromonas sp. SMS1]|uniref:SOS response-associated peptidase family protein n=1 Tax=Pseudoalteromonas sp. SMS1 TaxID=2908894 RepID=UPI001F48CA0B|nr:SOS response-associated peptidase family protein [Pseudoalteromonas sp. SMS1]MCF2856423.1 SOS response-associated peptidase [Pseudoalteromonas sp. SMS1]
MCGRLNITDDPFVIQILLDLGIKHPHEHVHFGRFKRATDTISIVHQDHGKRRISSAIWWLLLTQTQCGFKPSKYTSFNSRYDKLHVQSSAAYRPFRYSRCIIVVKGFGETQFQNGKPLHYHDFIAKNNALCLAGLYKHWQHPISGKSVLSCSVITLPPHPKLRPYHDKASPMMLPQDPELLNSWLDDRHHEVAEFTHLLVPHLYQTLTVQKIDKPSCHNPIAHSHVLIHD